MKVGNRVMLSLYLDPAQHEAVKKLSEKTRVPSAVYLREGVDLVLAKYSKDLKRKETKR